MLTDYTFVNYRAFRKGTVNLKPLTIVVGANNVGKTALLQLPLLIKQTASTPEIRFRGPLKLYGRELSVGLPEHLFYNVNTDEPLELEFGFNDDSLLKRLTEIVDETIGGILQLGTYAYLFSENAKYKDLNVQRQIAAHRKTIEPFVKSTRRSRGDSVSNTSMLYLR